MPLTRRTGLCSLALGLALALPARRVLLLTGEPRPTAADETPARLYVGLLDRFGREISDPGRYARAPMTLDEHSCGFVNATPLSFWCSDPHGWGSISGVGVFDRAAGGEPLFAGPLQAAFTIATEATVHIDAGHLGITADKVLLGALWRVLHPER